MAGMICLMEDGKWPSMGIPIAHLPFRLEGLAARLGARVKSWDDDGLSLARGFGFCLKSGRMFAFEELELKIRYGRTSGPELHVDELDYLTLGAKFLVEEVAGAVGISASEFTVSEPIYSSDIPPPSRPQR